MTAILLDTHLLLGLVAAPERIPSSVRDQLADHNNDLLVSAASAWEIAIKTGSAGLVAWR
ncbi:hypothetical protein MSM1_05225 [Mycobacterium sp. SM1]|uniref:hypothetical protein n=1 Tax=Mycobacterium sp. SM1 TaxID=2816243 RepID=UPI001BCB97E8|nr:hypothetical protein [Mycobacterium sp. SM1]MBS4727773.1 hypothetical protein [Mycobacterium sp. SM1]